MSKLVPTSTITSASASVPNISSSSWTLPHINNWSVGFDRHWRLLEDLYNSTSRSTYPPYNIIKIDNENYRVEIALAGFTKDEIEIIHHNGILKISGKKEVEVLSHYVHKGIAARDFEHQFALADYVEVKSAEFNNGILSVELKQELPEEKRPKTIKIS